MGKRRPQYLSNVIKIVTHMKQIKLGTYNCEVLCPLNCLNNRQEKSKQRRKNTSYTRLCSEALQIDSNLCLCLSDSKRGEGLNP